MKTVQLAIHDSDYAQLLRNLLVRDGMHRVYLVDQPDLQMDGVIVIDESGFKTLTGPTFESDRFVMITRKDADHLSRVWDAGIRHVVFQEDPANTAQLAIIAAELRLPRAAAASRPAHAADSFAEKHHATPAPCLPILETPARCRRCGLRNAHSQS